MAEPLRIEFEANTSKAQSAMASLAASIIANTATAGVALQGMASNTNSTGTAIGALEQNAKRAALSIGTDVKNIATATASAVTAEKATLSTIVSAFTAAAASSTTAQAGVRAGITGTGTALATLLGQVPALGAIAATLGGVVAGYVLVSAAVGQANDQLDKFTALGERAEKAGVSTGFVQRFDEIAEKAKLSAEQIEAALAKAGNAVTPRFNQEDGVRKQLNELFESGYLNSFQSEGLAAYNKATTNEGRIRAVVTSMQELNSLGERLAAIDLAEKVFGSETADRIRRGRLEIEAIAEALDRQRDDLVSQEQVRQAEEFKQRLNDAYREIDAALGVSVNLTAEGREFLNVWLAVVEAVAAASKAADGLLTKLSQARQDSQDFMGQLATALGAQAVNRYLFPNQGETRYDSPAGPPAPIDAPLPPRRPIDLLPSRTMGNGGRERASGGGASETDPIQSFINQLQKSAAALKAEADAFNLSNVEKKVAIELAKANEIASANGTKVTDAQAAAIRKLAEESANAKDKIADLEQAQRQAGEAARYFGNAAADALSEMIVEGRSAGEVFSNLLKSIEKTAIRALLTGEGPLAGLFQTAAPASGGSGAVGGLVGLISNFAKFNPIPALAGGGAVSGPGSGTSDSVLARLSNGEFVMNAKAAAEHRDLLEMLNRGLPGYAAGGLVGDLANFGKQTIPERGAEGGYMEIWK